MEVGCSKRTCFRRCTFLSFSESRAVRRNVSCWRQRFSLRRILRKPYKAVYNFTLLVLLAWTTGTVEYLTLSGIRFGHRSFKLETNELSRLKDDYHRTVCALCSPIYSLYAGPACLLLSGLYTFIYRF